MDFMNLTADPSLVQAHIELFACLLFALPPVSFLSIKFLITTRTASKVQRSTQRFVPSEPEAEKTSAVSDRPVAAKFPTH